MNIWAFRCFHCQYPLTIGNHGFCSRCVKQLSTSPYCQHCGTPLPEFHSHCGQCLKDEPKWQRIVQISIYKSPLADWIHRFKFQQDYWLDHALARLLLLEILHQRRERYFDLPEVILPVPLFWQRQWRRGYNQAELIAKPLSRWLNIPLDTQSLQRIRQTVSQRELSAVERRQNLKDAFAYQPKLPYRYVALVDDVVTTGSTLNSICLELRKKGVEKVIVWTLARA